MSLATTTEPMPTEVYTLDAPANYKRYELERCAVPSATGHWTLALGSDPRENKLYTYLKVYEWPWSSVTMVRLPGDLSYHWTLEVVGLYLFAHCELADGRPCWVRLDTVGKGWKPYGSTTVMTAIKRRIARAPMFPSGAVVMDLAALPREEGAG